MRGSSPQLEQLLNEAERVLAAELHPALARMVIDLARESAGVENFAPTVPPTRTDADMLTTREAAESLRVSEKQIYRMVADGRLPSYGSGRHHRFRAADLQTAIDRSSQPARVVAAARLASQPFPKAA